MLIYDLDYVGCLFFGWLYITKCVECLLMAYMRCLLMAYMRCLLVEGFLVYIYFGVGFFRGWWIIVWGLALNMIGHGVTMYIWKYVYMNLLYMYTFSKLSFFPKSILKNTSGPHGRNISLGGVDVVLDLYSSRVKFLINTLLNDPLTCRNLYSLAWTMHGSPSEHYSNDSEVTEYTGTASKTKTLSIEQL